MSETQQQPQTTEQAQDQVAPAVDATTGAAGAVVAEGQQAQGDAQAQAQAENTPAAAGNA